MTFWQRLQHNFRYGLLGQSVLFRLEKIGISLMPYYLYREKMQPTAQRFSNDQFRLERIRKEDIDYIADNFPDRRRIWRKTWERRLSDGEIGLLLKHGEKLAGFTWANLDACTGSTSRILFTLNDNEAYLHDMVVAEAYRGSNLASFLRLALLEELRNLGREIGYSISARFNKPAVRFKNKLNAERLELRCEIILFRRRRYDIRIRRYCSELPTDRQNIN